MNTESLKPSSCFRSPFSKGQSLTKVDEVSLLLLQVWIKEFSGGSSHGLHDSQMKDKKCVEETEGRTSCSF